MTYIIKNSFLNIEINSIGAEMQSIKKDNIEYLWQGDNNTWKNKATNIFPFVGKMQDGKYIYNGVTYEMGNHGFARHTNFIANKIGDDKIIFKMCSDENTLKVYPFIFDYFIIYHLKDNTIFITSKVINKDNKKMYFALGGHPGFIVPIDNKLKFYDYYLIFDNSCKINNIKTSNKGLVTTKEKFNLENNKILNLSYNLFDNDALIFENMAKGITLKTDKDNKSIHLKYENMNYLGIWQTPKKAPNFICIEPWTSLPSRDGIIEDIENQKGLICLKPNKEYENIWSITIN